MKLFSINTQKISVRLTIRYTMLITITLLMLSGITLASVILYMNEQSFELVENISETIEKKIEKNESFVENDLEDISQMNENISINIEKNGNIVFDTGDKDDEDFKIRTTEIGEAKIISYDDDNYAYINKGYTNQSGEKFIIQVIKDMEDEREFVELLFWILLILNIVAFLISIIIGYIMSKHALSPIEKIIKQAKEISASDLSKRINIEGPNDELKHLSKTFNEMISRIEKRYEIQNRFALDASHEIATPLSVINGYIDIIRRWGKEDPEVFNEAVQSIKKEIKNMTQMLDKLLFVAKNDNEISNVEKNTFYLNEIIYELVDESKIIYQNYSFLLEKNDKILIYADKKLIKQMLRAVLNNSVKYSEKNTQISISNKKKEKEAIIEISDQGVGIPKEDLPNIFDRFYRVDKARTRDLGGSGLGLSIVKWIVESHKGTINIESQLKKGTKVIIKLPIDT